MFKRNSWIFFPLIIALLNGHPLVADNNNHTIHFPVELGSMEILGLPDVEHSIQAVKLEMEILTGLISLITILKNDSEEFMIGADRLFIEIKDSQTLPISGLRLFFEKLGIADYGVNGLTIKSQRAVVGSRVGSVAHIGTGSILGGGSFASADSAHIKTNSNQSWEMNSEHNDIFYLEGQVNGLRLADSLWQHLLAVPSAKQSPMMSGDIGFKMVSSNKFTEITIAIGQKTKDGGVLRTSIVLNLDASDPFTQQLEVQIAVDEDPLKIATQNDSASTIKLAKIINEQLYKYEKDSQLITILQSALQKFIKHRKPSNAAMMLHLPAYPVVYGTKVSRNMLSQIVTELGLTRFSE